MTGGVEFNIRMWITAEKSAKSPNYLNKNAVIAVKLQVLFLLCMIWCWSSNVLRLTTVLTASAEWYGPESSLLNHCYGDKTAITVSYDSYP